MIEINDNVILVAGAKNAAIYDLNKNNLYSINSDALKIIKEVVCEGRATISDVEKNYIDSLYKKNLLSTTFCPKEVSWSNHRAYNLKFVWLELTNCCNYRCLHCYEGNTHNYDQQELSTEQWKHIISEISTCHCKSIQFTGGECLLRSDLLELIKYAHENEIQNITIFTNASLFTDEIITAFSKYNVKVKISIYGHNAATHDSITQIEGSFEKTTTNIIKLLNYGIDVTPAIVIMKNNENYLPDIIQYIKSLGLKYSGYDVIRNVYGGTQMKYCPTNKQILNSVCRNSPNFKISIDKFKVATKYNTCWYGKIAITSTGDVIPCVFERKMKLGNILHNSLQDILDSTRLKQCWDLDFSQIECCKDCEYRYACKDCRPLGLSICNSLTTKNPRCNYNPYIGQWKSV